MTMMTANINSLWGALLIEELIRNGVDYFVISPGSRSTPLTVAVARNPRARHVVCLDERGAAFHAIGYARATQTPAVLICTSGTAAANYFPAVIEASMDALPLIILSADRPPELRQTGTNQTIQQANLYGDYVRWQFELPCPDRAISPQMVLTTVDQAVYQARKSPCGPVHLNCMFREPLVPTPVPVDEQYLVSLHSWQQQTQPYSHYAQTMMLPGQGEIESLVEIIRHTQKGILVVGQLKSKTECQAVLSLAEKLNWMVFADIQSGIRLDRSLNNLIHYFDQVLLTAENHTIHADTILQLGSRITSKRFLQYLEQHPPTHHIAIIDDPFRHDPTHTISLRIHSSIAHLCELLLLHLEPSLHSDWILPLIKRSQVIDQCIDSFLFSHGTISEPAIARLISRYCPEGSGIFLASSMPIREMDMYGATKSAAIAIAANRGTSGIEGTIASASGFAVGLNAPVTLLIGDLSMLHDLNSLAILKVISQPVIVVVINNNGGGIFSFLPIANFPDVFETYFGTPHDLKFQQAAHLFGLDYYHPETIDEFIAAYQQAITQHQSAVLEVTTDRHDNLVLHQALQQAIQTALQNMR